MSLWTPYNDKSPLDLSVKNKNISSTSYAPAILAYLQYSSYPSANVVQRMNCYQLPSSSSQTETVYPPMEIRVLSPPTSPDSPSTGSRPHFMADVDALENDPNFQIFERDALRAMSEKNGGTLLGHNPRMRRAVQTGHNVDDSYRRQRERNNFAAKQSRDKRKLREIRLALKMSVSRRHVHNYVGSSRTRTAPPRALNRRHARDRDTPDRTRRRQIFSTSNCTTDRSRRHSVEQI